jgi:pimeloyl-ACP methyl ester carboxylesterase
MVVCSHNWAMEGTFSERVTAPDGTSIAFERIGAGPAVVLVGGGMDDGSENAPLATTLSPSFTVFNYARRGRDGSSDTQPYALQREFEDLAALIEVAGGSAHLFGASSGGALALEAAASGVAAGRIVVYEVPYNMADDWPGRWRAYVDKVRTAVAQAGRGEALEQFMRVTGSSDQEIAGFRSSPFWAGAEALAPTLPYDAACLGTGQPPVERFARITQPVLVATGDSAAAPDAAEWVLALDGAAEAIVAAIPNAQRATLAGQGHVADPEVIAATLETFFVSA